MMHHSFSGTHITVDGVRIHVLDSGSQQPPLLILPGITSPAATWLFVAERLAKLFRVLVVDLRGRGLSDTRPGLDYDLPSYCRDLEGVLAALRLTRVHVLGHALGGRIGVAYAAAHPEQVETLILADPPLSGPGRRPYKTPAAYYLDAIAEASQGASLAAFRQRYPLWSEEAVRLRLQWLPTCLPEAVEASHRNFQQEDVHTAISRLTCPALLLVGGKAGVILDEDIAELARLNPRLATRVLPTGHMMPWEDVEGFVHAIEAFSAPGRA